MIHLVLGCLCVFVLYLWHTAQDLDYFTDNSIYWDLYVAFRFGSEVWNYKMKICIMKKGRKILPVMFTQVLVLLGELIVSTMIKPGAPHPTYTPIYRAVV
jgi:hypothetical protein